MRDSGSRVKTSNGADALSLLHRTGLNLFVASGESELQHTVGLLWIYCVDCMLPFGTLRNVNLSRVT